MSAGSFLSLTGLLRVSLLYLPGEGESDRKRLLHLWGFRSLFPLWLSLFVPESSFDTPGS